LLGCKRDYFLLIRKRQILLMIGKYVLGKGIKSSNFLVIKECIVAMLS
jgi:hypothetical protein